MSKSVTVVSCGYVHTEDVDPDEHIKASVLNDAMEFAVNRSVAALENPTNGYNDFQRRNLQTVFQSMLSTHGLIRKVLSAGWQSPESIDALALARVPVEGLYTLSLMFESPAWIDVYLKDGWKKQYVRLLLECHETQKLKRFEDFCKKTAPRNLDALRTFMGITDAQVATINNEEIGTPIPDGMTKEHIDRFPTPSAVINKLPAGDKRRLLERLYAEYVFLCSFAHGLPDALLFKMMFNKNPPVPHAFDDEKVKDTFHRQVEQPAYTTSLISLVQAASELTVLYPTDVELRAAVVKAWDKIVHGMLLGRVVWNLRTKKLLGILDASPPRATSGS